MPSIVLGFTPIPPAYTGVRDRMMDLKIWHGVMILEQVLKIIPIVKTLQKLF